MPSPTVIQTALNNAATNPELYSPSFSPVNETSNKESRLTHEAKKKLDSAFQKPKKPEDTPEKDELRQRVNRGQKKVVHWLDTKQCGEYDLEEATDPDETGSPSISDHSRLNSSGNVEATPDTPQEEFSRDYNVDITLDSDLLAVLKSTSRHERRASKASKEAQEEATSSRHSPMLSTSTHLASVPSPVEIHDDTPSLRQRAAKWPQGQETQTSNAQHLRALRRQRQEAKEAISTAQVDLRDQEERLQRKETEYQHQSRTDRAPSDLSGLSMDSRQRKAALEQEIDDAERYKKPWSPPTPRGAMWNAIYNKLIQNLDEGERSGHDIPSEASLSAASTEELDLISELELPSSALSLSTSFSESAAVVSLPEGILANEYPTKQEAQWLYFWMRNLRARDRVEGRPIPQPEEPFPLEKDLLPKIMKTPSRKFRVGIEAAKRKHRLSAERKPTAAAGAARAPEPPADIDPESDIDSPASQEQKDVEIHGVVHNEDGPGWLREWLTTKGYAKPADLHLHPYKGYNVDAPKLQLIRAKNFLSAHDAKNMRDWGKKFDEIVQYAKHLYESYKDEDWGYDLFEVLNMLQTHRIWEKHRYSDPKLNIDINSGKGSIYSGPRRFPYDNDSGLVFKKDYRPPGAPKFQHERGSVAGKAPGLFIQPHCVEKPPKDENVEPRAYTKGIAWYNGQERKWVEWTKEHAVKEAWGHKKWSKRQAAIMPLPPVANFNGPVVNILMDKEMHKTYEKIKHYEALVAKLRRTVWKTAVYGKREALTKCLEGIERGLNRQTLLFQSHEKDPKWMDFDYRQPHLVFPIRPKELEWLEFLTLTAPSDSEPVRGERKLSVFLKRIETLLANPRGDGVFAKHAKKSRKAPLGELVEAINFGLKEGDVQRGPKKVYIFDEETVWQYAGIAEKLGMVHRARHRKDGEVIRAVGELTIRGLLPEQRIRWNDRLAEKRPQVNPETAVEEVSEDDNDDTSSVASTVSTHISIPSSEPDYGDYTMDFPKSGCLRSWVPQDENDRQSPSERKMTQVFYETLGASLGLTLRDLCKKLAESELAMVQSYMDLENPKEDMIVNNQAFLRDTLAFWADDYNKRTRNYKNPAANGERQTPLFKDIVEIADPESQGRTWVDKDDWDDKEEHQAREKVRQGLIREAYANEPNIYPARSGNSSADEPGNKFPCWRREPLWDFGAPEARGFKARQFFSINRWPLHLQSKERQEEIKSSGPPVEEWPKKWEGPREWGIRYGPSKVLGGDERTVWMPGNKYWFGATPRQQREIWRRTHVPKPPTWKDKIAGFFGVKRKRDEQDDMDEFEAGSLRLPKPRYLPKIIENRNAVERRAKRARLSG